MPLSCTCFLLDSVPLVLLKINSCSHKNVHCWQHTPVIVANPISLSLLSEMSVTGVCQLGTRDERQLRDTLDSQYP